MDVSVRARTVVKKMNGISRKTIHAHTQMVRTEPKAQPQLSAHSTPGKAASENLEVGSLLLGGSAAAGGSGDGGSRTMVAVFAVGASAGMLSR